MNLCTKLSDRVLDLETTKTAQAKEIASLKKRVKKLERKRKSKPPGMKRLFKIGRSTQVVSSVKMREWISILFGKGLSEEEFKLGDGLTMLSMKVDIIAKEGIETIVCAPPRSLLPFVPRQRSMGQEHYLQGLKLRRSSHTQMLKSSKKANERITTKIALDSLLDRLSRTKSSKGRDPVRQPSLKESLLLECIIYEHKNSQDRTSKF
ncbi:hypothetical protein Tco_1370835 [Tanacetum coccineum]